MTVIFKKSAVLRAENYQREDACPRSGREEANQGCEIIDEPTLENGGLQGEVGRRFGGDYCLRDVRNQ